MTNPFLIGIEWEPQFTLLNFPNHSVYFKNTHKRKPNIWTQPAYADPHSTEKTNYKVNIELPSSFGIWRSSNVSNNNMNKNKSYRYTSIDGINFEVITKPTIINRLSKEIQKAEQNLKKFCLVIAPITGPLGVFLPTWQTGCDIPSKHVNISSGFGSCVIPDSEDQFTHESFISDKKGFTSKIEMKGECHVHRQRIHISVPYNFNDYAELLSLFDSLRIDKSSIMRYLFNWSLKYPMPSLGHKRKRGIFLGYVINSEYHTMNNLL